MKRFLSALVLSLLPFAALADAVNPLVPECDGPGALNCSTTLRTNVGAGSGVLSTYVKQDDDGWLQLSCLGRGGSGYVHDLAINWIWIEHRHKFSYRSHTSCDPLTPVQTPVAAVGNDEMRYFLDGPADPYGTPDYAYVFRETNGVKEWLRFDYVWVGSGGKGQYMKLPSWTVEANAQWFKRRSGHILAAMAFSGNAGGLADVENHSAWAKYQTQPPCVIRHTLTYRWITTYDKINDSWLWSSGTGIPSLDAKEIRVHCGGDYTTDQAAPLVALLKNEGTAAVWGRNYGIRERRGDIAKCGTPGYPSVCQN